ncbi:hypothetical protein LTR41_004616 [Exophiala xenobiotica]|nr:hypothetical protein LTR41_004616 [Exophiala xenobiotica]
MVSDLTQNLCSKWLSDDSSLAFRFNELLAWSALEQENWLDALQHAQKAEEAAIRICGPSNKRHPRVLSMQSNMGYPHATLAQLFMAQMSYGRDSLSN